MGGFWDKHMGKAPAAPVVQSPYMAPAAPQPGQAQWWMAPKAQATTVNINQYRPGVDGPTLEELSRMDASELSAEALEMIAQWKIQKNPRYSEACPHCGSAAGWVQARANTAPRCMECGYSDRLMHELPLQPLTKLRKADSWHARGTEGGYMEGSFQHASQSPWGNVDRSMPGV